MQKRLVPIILFCLAAVLVALAHLSGRNMAAPAFTFAEAEKEVYLTFDDGPSTSVTNDVLDILAEKGVKATFFVVGDRVRGREDILRRTVSEGHVVGVHSQTHRYEEIYASEEAFLKDVTACEQVIERVTGVRPRVYRFPGGGKHERMAALLRERGYKIVWWNAVCGDEEIPGADAATLERTACETAAGKQNVVLLMHDSAPHKATAEALPKIIDYFLRNQYVFKTF